MHFPYKHKVLALALFLTGSMAVPCAWAQGPDGGWGDTVNQEAAVEHLALKTMDASAGDFLAVEGEMVGVRTLNPGVLARLELETWLYAIDWPTIPVDLSAKLLNRASLLAR